MGVEHDCTTHLMNHAEGKRHLPQPRGPHSVGFFDLMTPGTPQTGSLLRVYFPTNEQCLEEHERWPIWGEDKYISGILTFLKSMVHRWPSWAQRGEYYQFDSLKHIFPFVPSFGFPTLFRVAVGGDVFVPIIRNADPIRRSNGRKWPVIVFSHGMGCGRFTYSQICYDLASHGFVVAAPEHRDGSGCMSFYNEGPRRHLVHHRRVEHAEDEYSVRNGQVQQRVGEVKRTLDILTAINKGDYVENILQPADIVTEMDLTLLKGCLDFSETILCGHSFGGATTLLTLSQDSRFKCGVILDGWLYPIRDEDIAKLVKQPLLFINTESFLHPENLTKISTFSTSDEAERTCFCIKGSVHQNHLDTPFVVQRPILKRILGIHSDTCPETVMDLTNKLMIQFIRKQVNLDEDKETNDEIDRQKKILIQGFDFEILNSQKCL